MKAIGIIAEYNPFTNGHLYHLNTIKEKYPDYVIIAVIPSTFTQRGIPAIIDKWKRTEIILKLGVDLVIELPFPFATQSADIFSYGAITILEYLHVEKVIFGSESDSLDDLKAIAEAQIANPDFDKLVKVYSKMGNNYPTAVSNAVYDIIQKRITTPNDLLGISYIKTILREGYHLEPEIILRNNDYHGTDLSSTASASAIREALRKGESVQDAIPDIEVSYLTHLHFLEDYFPYIQYKIITESDLSKYQTVEEGIEYKLKQEISHCNSVQELIEQIKSKRFTYNKITRMLIHVLCGFTKKQANEMKKISYIRVLGFQKRGRNYLNHIKNEIAVPIISKIHREKDNMLEYEIEVTKIYDMIYHDDLSRKEFNKIVIYEDGKESKNED